MKPTKFQQIEFFEEFHNRVGIQEIFEMSDSTYEYCYDTDCYECCMREKCNKTFDETIDPYFDMTCLETIKEKFPELFI